MGHCIDFSHGGNAHDFTAGGKRNIIDFSANINPLGLSRAVKKFIRENPDRILSYPDIKGREIIRQISDYWGIKKENVLLGNGSLELIHLITQVFKPKSTLIPQPTFSEYERAARNTSSRVRFLPLKEENGFRPDPSCRENGDIFFLCNPNNPTGNLILENRKLFKRVKCGLLVVDEAFMDFLPDEKNHTFVRKAAGTKKIAVLRTFTKFFALPGLRIGYLVAHAKIIDRLKKYQIPWNTNSLGQPAAKIMLSDKRYISETHAIIAKERKFLFAGLSRTEGLQPHASRVNFLLIKIEKSGLTAKALQERLIKNGILVRDCTNFRGLDKRYIRVAVRSRVENTKLLDALRRAL